MRLIERYNWIHVFIISVLGAALVAAVVHFFLPASSPPHLPCSMTARTSSPGSPAPMRRRATLARAPPGHPRQPRGPRPHHRGTLSHRKTPGRSRRGPRCPHQYVRHQGHRPGRHQHRCHGRRVLRPPAAIIRSPDLHRGGPLAQRRRRQPLHRRTGRLPARERPLLRPPDPEFLTKPRRASART